MIACPHARWFLLALNKHDTTAKMLYFAIVEFQRVLSSMSYHQQYKTYWRVALKQHHVEIAFELLFTH
jgi:hypothetical protein